MNGRLKVLSLFSGIGAFEKALGNLAVDYELVNYCEIDKFASKAYSVIHKVSEELNLGDISQVNEKNLPDFDLMTWGFPCTDISIAGKQKGFIDENGEVTRSGLYYEGIRILKHKKPKYSIIENVKNLTTKKFEKEFALILSDLKEAGYNNYWRVLNAKDYGIPQNRERVFIVSIRKDVDDGSFEFSNGYDSGLRLKHLLQDEVDEKYYLSSHTTSRLDVEDIEHTGFVGFKKKGKEVDIASTLLARDYKGMGNQGMNVVKEKLVFENNERQIKINGEIYYNPNNEYYKSVENREYLGYIGNAPKQATKVFKPEIANTLVANGGGQGGKTSLYHLGYAIRKLTPIECFRLMGFDDEDVAKLREAKISDTQIYKMAGNSIVVNVLESFLPSLLKVNYTYKINESEMAI
ncbi:hypothetical protein CHH83_01815 [Bacillus sp. 7586-K]|nr:hypothetical protein CHH83_01815 [Bacillus sp. 7586-K]